MVNFRSTNDPVGRLSAPSQDFYFTFDSDVRTDPSFWSVWNRYAGGIIDDRTRDTMTAEVRAAQQQRRDAGEDASSGQERRHG